MPMWYVCLRVGVYAWLYVRRKYLFICCVWVGVGRNTDDVSGTTPVFYYWWGGPGRGVVLDDDDKVSFSR